MYAANREDTQQGERTGRYQEIISVADLKSFDSIEPADNGI